MKTDYNNTNALEIINSSSPLEESITKIWQHNVFFILWYGIKYIYFFIASVINRLCRMPKMIKCWIKKTQYAYCRKVSTNSTIETHNLIIDSNIFTTFGLMLLFLAIGIGKLFYHAGIIVWWIIKKMIVPVVLWLSALFAVLALSGNKKSE